jgi:flagellar motility protein MotE (MotC chaperone)
MDSESLKETSKRKKVYKIITIVIISIIIVPLSIISVVYFNNKTFKNKVNNALGKTPGALGDYFRNYPTETERIDKKTYLANYYLNLDTNIAADKIYIIKKNDEELYVDIIKIMNSITSSKTEDIVGKVRNIELRKDLLFSIYDEVQKEKENEILGEVSRLDKQDLLITIKEVEKRYEEEMDYINNLSKILYFMREDKTAEILYYIDPRIKDQVLGSFDPKKSSNVEAAILKKTIEENKLEDLAKLYEAKPVDIAIKEIGNIEGYSINQLAKVYKNLSILKSAEILSKINDENFTEELFSAIRREEELNKDEISIAPEISRSIEFVSEYQQKITDLVAVYEKMGPDKVAKIVEKMMVNDKTVTSLEIDANPIYEISDRLIIVDVLTRMKNQTLSKVLNYMEADKASQITQLLAKPNTNN